MKILPIALAAVFGIAGVAQAQQYPSRPITMIVPYATGGSTDAIGRIIADRMRASLGQAVIPENVTGANGSIGVGRAAHPRHRQSKSEFASVASLTTEDWA
jgi:tripartite-type tricarboxylate transporter receptor subunit TctC